MKYTIGIDFGTLSARCVVAAVETGEVLASCVSDYAHGVMTSSLPDGTPLGVDWALEHPGDHLDALKESVTAAVKQSGVRKEDIIGIGLDFTSCTVLPVKKDGTPLCMLPKFASTPSAYVKLWKHHGAQPEANYINSLAGDAIWVRRYGGRISSEAQLPKFLETINDAPEVFDEADYFMESGDWVVMMLTGEAKKSICGATLKGCYDPQLGYPADEELSKIHPKLVTLVHEKLDYPIVYLGERAGGLTEEMAQKLGLCPGISVAASIIDAHCALPAVKVYKKGQLMASVGTSSGLILVGDEDNLVPGLTAVVKDGVYRDMYCYEAGQVCVGDHFAWAAKTCCPPSYGDICRERGINAHTLLTELAAKQKPGESGLLALDWWNGNRCILEDADLSGVMLGMTLDTKPEEIYRALLEAHTYGVRIIVDTMRQGGIEVNEIIAGGGIPFKSPLLMQIYADVMNLPITIAGSDQSGALGAAIFAAAAAGTDCGGYGDVFTAIEAMGHVSDVTYMPIKENVEVYEKLYREFVVLHDYFGRGENDVMKRLKALKQEVKG